MKILNYLFAIIKKIYYWNPKKLTLTIFMFIMSFFSITTSFAIDLFYVNVFIFFTSAIIIWIELIFLFISYCVKRWKS